MRLISATLRSYRIHRETTVAFDGARTLIGGPNESGKSTLIEGIHRGLFLRAKTGGALREDMKSAIHPGEPEVELVFEAAGSRWSVEKRFAGTKGTTRLANSSGEAFRDDEAESKLADLLRVEGAGGRVNASQLAGFWSHLWVWQGMSGTDPSCHATPQMDTLVRRLQQDGLSAVMQSETDRRVRERIAGNYQENFTSTGRPKAGSRLEAARAKMDETTAALDRARGISERLERAAAEHQQAEREIAEATAILPPLRVQIEATDARLAEVTKLKQIGETHEKTWQAAVSLRQQISESDKAIRRVHDQAGAAQASLLPSETREMELIARETALRKQDFAAQSSLREIAGSLRQIRLNCELSNARITAFEKEEIVAQLQARSDEVSKLRTEIAEARGAVAKLPPLTAKDLENLRRLDRAAHQATASLNAMATRVDVVVTDQPVTLDGSSLGPGDPRILTDAGELAIGHGTRIRIQPGGGTSLAAAREQQEKAARDFTTALDRLALNDLDHATSVLLQRETQSQHGARLETRWEALGGKTLDSELAAARTASQAAIAEVARRISLAGNDDSPPADLESARQQDHSLRQQLQAAEAAETHANRHAAQIRQQLDTAAAQRVSHREQSAHHRQNLSDLTTRLHVMEETHGSAEARSLAITQAATDEQAGAERLASTRESLAALAPELLAADRERFSRSVTQQETRLRDAENRRLIARDRLTLDGSTDPHVELETAKARHAEAFAHFQSVQRHASAIELLHQLFATSREAVDDAIVHPLARRISGYLQCLFGPATKVRVNLSEGGISGLELVRANDPNFNFNALSGGAREQVAAAVRFGMAEILAADHDGTLPVVFDDAFAYTDPDRVRTLQRMLDLAANRGLQVIVVSCTPADYAAFGASEIRLGG